MGMKDNITAVRGDLNNHAQNFFIFYFEKYPSNQNAFAHYKGKDVKSLKSVGSFPVHTAKVLGMLLEVAERADVQLKQDAQTLVKMPQHKELNADNFKDLFLALVPYLQKELGASCDANGWKVFGDSLVQELRNAGM